MFPLVLILPALPAATVEVNGYASERLQLTLPSATSPSSTRDLPQLQSLTEGSALLRLRLLQDMLTVVVDGSAFVTAQGGYADARDGELVAVADHDVPADPRVVFAEAYVRLQPINHLDITVGKRRVVWGAGMAFNPTDILNPPRDPTDSSLQRTGIPLVLVEVPFSGFAMSALFAPAVLEEKNGIPSILLRWPDVPPAETVKNPLLFPDPRDDELHWAAALRAYALLVDTDVNVWALAMNGYGPHPRRNDLRVNFSLSRIFLDIHEAHAEVMVQRGSDRLYAVPDCVDRDADDDDAALGACVLQGRAPIARLRADDDDIKPRFLVGTRSMFEDESILSVEWLYQADGLLQDEFDDLVTLQARVGALVRDDVIDGNVLTSGADASGIPARLAVTPLRRHHVVVSWQKPRIMDDFTVQASAIVAAEDLSAILTGAVTWQATEWLQISAWGFVPTPSLPRALHDLDVDATALWPAVVDGIPYGEYDVVPFTARCLLEARAWF